MSKRALGARCPFIVLDPAGEGRVRQEVLRRAEESLLKLYKNLGAGRREGEKL